MGQTATTARSSGAAENGEKTVCWLVDGRGTLAQVHGVEELTAKLAEVSKHDPHAPILGLQRGTGSLLHVGVAGDIGFLNYIEPVEGPEERAFVSVGNSAEEGSVWFSYAGSGSEIPRRNCLPMVEVLRAAAEYFQTGRMPASVKWELD